MSDDAPDFIATSCHGEEPPQVNARKNEHLGGLHVRQTYERGKIPVVLIHGLWGYSNQWQEMIRNLEAIPSIKARYQFWTFTYATVDPIPASAHQLREALRHARRTFDPTGSDDAFDRMVLVGHSLGGVLAKMMAQSSGSRLWQTVSVQSIDRIVGEQDCRQLFQQMYFYERVPEVSRIIFIATPHRGSPIASGLVRTLGMQISYPANGFRKAREALLANNEPALFTDEFRNGPMTSVSELAPEHPLLKALCDLRFDPSLRFHSIIADHSRAAGRAASDGVVPYASSHLDDAESELLVQADHACLENRDVIRETQRILIEHAEVPRASRSSAIPIASPATTSTQTSASGR